MANSAAHRQYLGGEVLKQKLDELLDTPPLDKLLEMGIFASETYRMKAEIQKAKERLLDLEGYAKEKGTSYKNPDLFVIKHIFFDLISNQVEG